MQGGVDWELRTAEDAMVAAPGGSKELALAMRRHADGVRNMMQSELVPSFQNAIDGISEKHTVRILTEVAVRLDHITAYVQQGVATGVKALAVAEKGLVVGQKALGVGEKALTIGKKALAVSQSNATRIAEVEKTVAALKKGQTASDAQIKRDVAELRIEIAALRAAADLAARIAEEHTRLTTTTVELDRRLAQIEAWKALLEARGTGDG